MTSSTPITAVPDGTTSTAKAEHGLSVLRRMEGQALIQIALDALWQATSVGDQIRKGLGITTGDIPYVELQRKLLEALACMETADHYLRMLDGVIDPGDEPKAADPASGETEPPW
jgi:hypothetical protein